MSRSDGRVAISGRMFKEILMLIASSCGGHLRQRDRRWGQIRQTTTADARLDEGKATSCSAAKQTIRRFGCQRGWLGSNFVAARLDETENHTQQPMGIWEMSAQMSET